MAVALFSTSVSMGLQHIHLYVSHEHEDHEHGPAWHTHTQAQPRAHHGAEPHDGAPEIESCDAGTHAAALEFVCGEAPRDRDLVAVTVTRLAVTRFAAMCRVTPPADVRVHGPPPRTGPSLRAPPASRLT